MSTTKETTMPSKTALPTRQEVEQQAADLAAKLDAFRQQDQQQAAVDQQRRTKAHEEFDRQFVADYRSAADEADVRQARETLEVALRENPFVRAFADYVTTLRRVSHRQAEVSAALTRLGRPSFRPVANVTEVIGGLDEFVLRAVDRIADERIEVERSDLHARRDAAGDNPKENR